jgi:hypothetical protein
MWAVIAFCLALPPVLLLGTLCIELLLWEAPRRGKRPDVKSRDASSPGQYIRVTTTGGLALRGTPQQVVNALIQAEFDGAPMPFSGAPMPFSGAPPFPLTTERAQTMLENWAAAGRLSLQGEW